MKAVERKLPPPPRAHARPEFPAIIEPALRDIPQSLTPMIEGGFEVVKSAREDRSSVEKLSAEAQQVALADVRVRKALGERYSIIGVRQIDDDKDRSEPAMVLVAYRYGIERALEVWLAGTGGRLHVQEILEVDYQPPPSDEEIERAITLARGSKGVSEHLKDGYEATAILSSDVDAGDQHHGRRRFTVGFGPPDERQPRIRTLVDLSAERVAAVDVSGDREPEEGG